MLLKPWSHLNSVTSHPGTLAPRRYYQNYPQNIIYCSRPALRARKKDCPLLISRKACPSRIAANWDLVVLGAGHAQFKSLQFLEDLQSCKIGILAVNMGTYAQCYRMVNMWHLKKGNIFGNFNDF